jgi:nicotinamidase-related amidase
MPEAAWEFGHELKATFRLEPARTALVIVDMQYASAWRTTGVGQYLADRGKGDLFDWRFTRIEQVVLPNLIRLLGFFREHGLRVIHLTIGSELADFSDMPEALRPFARAADNRVGAPNQQILPDLAPQGDELVVLKKTQSAFMSSGFDNALRAIGIRDLCFGGVSTNACVDGTARDASDRSYRSVMIEDACSATREDHHRAALSSFASQAGRVLTTDEVIAELSSALVQPSPTLSAARG